MAYNTENFKKIAEILDLEIKVSSELKKGTTFTITFKNK